MPLPDFHVSEPFTLGIELEMQVVNPPGYDLSQDSSMLIDAVKNEIIYRRGKARYHRKYAGAGDGCLP